MHILSPCLLKSVVLLTFAIVYLNGCAGYVYHRDITKTKDGGYIIVKDFTDFGTGKTVLKLRSDMIQEWQWQTKLDANYQGMQSSKEQGEILNLIETKDNSYVGVGRRKSESKFRAGNSIKISTFFNPLIFNLDSLGKKSWEIVLKNNGYLVNVVQISNGDFIACGANIRGYKRAVIPQEKGLLIRFNQSGKIIWAKEILNLENCTLIIQTEDNGILLVGSVVSRNLYVTKFDPDGLPVWQRTIDIVTDGAEIAERYGGLLESNDGSYVLAGSIYSGKNDNYIFIVCLKSDGELKWKTLIKPEDTGKFSLPPNIYDIKQLTTNDYIVVGTMVPNKSLGFLSKISSDGQELWTVGTYNDGKREILRRIHANPDGSYTLYGLSSEEGSGEKIWTLKLSANGEVLNGN